MHQALHLVNFQLSLRNSHYSPRLRKRAKHLRRWPTKRGITCYRLYERDVPEIPLVVDVYEDAIHITEYDRPHERDIAEHANWLDLMARTAAECLSIASKNVFLKSRGRQKGKSQHDKVAETHTRKEVHEGGLKFLVNLSDYVDTGLFLDHRVTRGRVRDPPRARAFLTYSVTRVPSPFMRLMAVPPNP